MSVHLEDSYLGPHDSGCTSFHVVTIGNPNRLLCGHCREVLAVDLDHLSGLHIGCEQGVGVWLMSGGEWHRCHREVSEEDFAELVDLSERVRV